jgi:hypothetical protein
VAESFVTGIAPTQKVDELEKMLAGISGIDNARLTVITKATRGEEHERSFLTFVHTGKRDIDAEVVGGHIGADDAIIGGSGGTGVPGLAPGSPWAHLEHPHVAQHVGELPIPDDEADNYNDAIEDGRTVVAYKLNGDKDAALAGFHAAGLSVVRSY